MEMPHEPSHHTIIYAHYECVLVHPLLNIPSKRQVYDVGEHPKQSTMARSVSCRFHNKFNQLIGKNRMSQDEAQAVAVTQLRAFIERIERLEEEKKTISDDIKQIYSEAKNSGFDTKAMRTIIRLRQKEDGERQEEEAMIGLYKDALGMR